MTLVELRARVRAAANPERARQSQRYFKTGPGQYGEGDIFLGLNMPTLRTIAQAFRSLPLADCLALLHSEYHEERALALLIMCGAYPKSDAAAQEQLYQAYLDHTTHINNWDLVDVSAPHIVGAHLWPRSREPLYDLARSASLWERRIAIIATMFFIRRDDFADTLALAGILRSDRHDLIHKAVGWMLREVGQRNQEVAEGFLRRHYRVLPRTMLRYAIERFPATLRQQYLRGEIG